MDKEWFLTQLAVIGKRRVYQIVARKYLEPGGSDKDPVVTEWFHEKGFRETAHTHFIPFCLIKNHELLFEDIPVNIREELRLFVEAL